MRRRTLTRPLPEKAQSPTPSDEEAEKVQEAEGQSQLEAEQPAVCPPKRRRGRPRKSEQKPVESNVSPSVKLSAENNGTVVLNARGMPIRQRKRNRFYEDEDDLETKTKMEKRMKTEPMQILLQNPGSVLQITPIMSEGIDLEPEEVEITPVVQLPVARKSVVKLIISSPPTVNVTDSQTVKVTPKVVDGNKDENMVVAKHTTPNVPGPSKVVAPKIEVARNGVGNKVGYPRLESTRRSESFTSFIRFFANIKTKVVLPDRWGINGMMYDPKKRMKTFIMSEMSIAETGDPVTVKSIRVFEDLSLMITINGKDLTGSLESLKVQTEQDLASILSKVNALKVCMGVKRFEADDLTFHPLAVKKGPCYFSHKCQAALLSNGPGALCGPCNKIRMAIRNRRMKAKQHQEQAAKKADVKNVASTFGRNLYGVLDRLMTENKTKNKRQAKGRPLSEIRMESAAEGTHGRRSCGPIIKPPKRIKTAEKARKAVKTSGTGTITATPVTLSQTADSGIGIPLQQAYLADGTVVNYVTLGDGNGENIVIQHGGEFTLADGQEYEIIGEAGAVEPLQILGTDQQSYQIIDVGDLNIAQFAQQNVDFTQFNNLYDGSNIQVTEVDLNDDNSTMFKVVSLQDDTLVVEAESKVVLE